MIRRINRDDHGTLIRLLQRAESWLVIEHVAPRLLGRVPVMTLHDAIYCRCADLPKVEAAFRDAMADLDIQLALKIESGQ